MNLLAAKLKGLGHSLTLDFRTFQLLSTWQKGHPFVSRAAEIAAGATERALTGENSPLALPERAEILALITDVETAIAILEAGRGSGGDDLTAVNAARAAVAFFDRRKIAKRAKAVHQQISDYSMMTQVGLDDAKEAIHSAAVTFGAALVAFGLAPVTGPVGSSLMLSGGLGLYGGLRQLASDVDEAQFEAGAVASAVVSHAGLALAFTLTGGALRFGFAKAISALAPRLSKSLPPYVSKGLAAEPQLLLTFLAGAGAGLLAEAISAVTQSQSMDGTPVGSAEYLNAVAKVLLVSILGQVAVQGQIRPVGGGAGVVLGHVLISLYSHFAERENSLEQEPEEEQEPGEELEPGVESERMAAPMTRTRG